MIDGHRKNDANDGQLPSTERMTGTDPELAPEAAESARVVEARVSEVRRVTVADASVETWRRAGVSRVFGIPGGYLTLALDSLSRAGMPYVRSLHEGAAAFESAGYTMASHHPGVVMAQSGPGVTNLVTGVAAAYSECVPMLVVASQAPLAHYARDGHQEAQGTARDVAQASIMAQCTSVVYRPSTPDAALRSMRQALSRAISGRSPTAVELPVDLTGQLVDVEGGNRRDFVVRNEPVDGSAVAYVARALRAAQRPLLVLGDRIAHRGCGAALSALCLRQQIPFAVVGQAKGIVPEDHPYYAGVLEQSGHNSTFALAAAADLTVTLGLTTTIQVTNGYNRSFFQRLIQIDEDNTSMARAYPVELGAVSHLPRFVEALADELDGAISAQRSRPEPPRFDALRGAAKGAFSTPVALAVLRAELPRDCLVVGDCGLNLQYVKHCFPVYADDGFFSLYTLAAMGSGLPVGIGVALARAPQRVLSIIGDGGILVYLAELSVAAQLQLPLITAVINNGGYRQVGDRLANYYDVSFGCSLPDVDFVAVAEACGVMGRRVRGPEELAVALRAALEHNGPVLIEICVEGDSLYDVTPPEVRAWQDRILAREPRVLPWPFNDQS